MQPAQELREQLDPEAAGAPPFTRTAGAEILRLSSPFPQDGQVTSVSLERTRISETAPQARHSKS